MNSAFDRALCYSKHALFALELFSANGGSHIITLCCLVIKVLKFYNMLKDKQCDLPLILECFNYKTFNNRQKEVV